MNTPALVTFCFSFTEEELRDIAPILSPMTVAQRIGYICGRWGDDDAPRINYALHVRGLL